MVSKLALLTVLVLLGVTLAKRPRGPRRNVIVTGNNGTRPNDDKNDQDQDQDNLKSDRQNIKTLMTKVRKNGLKKIRPKLREIMQTQSVDVPETLLAEISDLKVNKKLQRNLRKLKSCRDKALQNDANVDICLKKLMKVIRSSPKVRNKQDSKPNQTN